jgi:hypothetical protein
MSDNRFLQVALGLAAVYAMLSLMTSHLNELVASWTAARARKLEEALRSLVGDSGAKGVLEHPLVQALAFTNIGKPSYIPGATFARAFVEHAASLRQAVIKAAPSTWGELLESLPGPVRQRVEPVIDHANASLDEVRTHLEAWFDDAMDRASGGYKRYTQRILLLLGLAVAAATNADTIAIASGVWTAVPARAVTELVAQKEVERCKRTEGKVDCPGLLDDLAHVESMPLGWSLRERKATVASPEAFVLKVIGILLTGFAVSLGAPFWFELLRRLAPLAATGPKPERRKPA